MNACTVTTRRRIPFAAALAESFLQHHPEGSFSAVLVDENSDRIEQPGGGWRLLSPTGVGFERHDLSRMAMIWPEPLLKRALVPHLLGALIEQSSGPCLFFSDDTVIYDRLDDLFSLTGEVSLVLCRRTGVPLPEDGFSPTLSDLLEAGLCDPGFVGAGRSGEKCLQFWRELIHAESLSSASDQTVPKRVIDLLAGCFSHHLCIDPGTAVSFWNLWQRPLHKSGEGLAVERKPLRFFRFDGYDPSRPHLLSTGQGPKPRVLLSEREDLRAVTRDYAGRLMKAGFEQSATLPYGFDLLPSGIKVDRRMRNLYKRQLARSVRGEGPSPPDPFDPETSAQFVHWLNSPDQDGPAPFVSRYLHALYEERGDLRAAFPGIAKADAKRYLDWVVEYGMEEAALPAELCPVEPPGRTAGTVPDGGGEDGPAVTESPASGLNVVGHFKAELGVGEMGRRILRSVEAAGISFATSTYPAFRSRQSHPYVPAGEEFSYDVNLFCVNADQLPLVVRDFGSQIIRNRYSIGVWWWEVDLFPAAMAASAELLDEIWVGSEYVQEAVTKATEQPVHLLPVPIRQIEARPIDRGVVGLPEGFMFLFTFDFLSIVERKNPLGVIQAFKQAFEEKEGPMLLIKTINGLDHLDELEKLRMAACGRSDIKIFDGYLSGEDNDRLLASCDCYVSLHRAEGYGLGMAEAMALGKPIIATGYSGNLAYLNDSNSILVPYRVVPVADGAGPYPAGAHWAEPDLEKAAEAMRRVFFYPEEAQILAQKAKSDAANVHTVERTARFIAGRLTAIRRQQGPGPEGALPGQGANSSPSAEGLRGGLVNRLLQKRRQG